MKLRYILIIVAIGTMLTACGSRHICDAYSEVDTEELNAHKTTTDGWNERI